MIIGFDHAEKVKMKGGPIDYYFTIDENKICVKYYNY